MDQNDFELIGIKAREASTGIGKLSTNLKNEVLKNVAAALNAHSEEIIEANAKDVELAKEKGMTSALIDRLTLTKERIADMAEGLDKLVDLKDIVGDVLEMKKLPNELMVGRKRVPLGVVAIIYESRPNVTVDAFGLCFKTNNVCILKGGSDSFNSNDVLVRIIKDELKKLNVSEDAICLVNCNREEVKLLMRLNRYIDVIIPRGSAKLINSCIENSTIPVIETGTGNCHVYVEKSADYDMALNIIENAKTQRIGTCNTCESLVVDKEIAKEFIPLLSERLKAKNVEIRGDELSREYSDYIIPATEEDYGKEYLDYIISLKCVDGIDEAINHINKYNTKHSESIITNNYTYAERFLNEIDAACVYVNASTRFTDGFQFGFGAEIGISTQKLHARGPMGLEALTTTKYIIYGNGQIRQ